METPAPAIKWSHVFGWGAAAFVATLMVACSVFMVLAKKEGHLAEFAERVTKLSFYAAFFAGCTSTLAQSRRALAAKLVAGIGTVFVVVMTALAFAATAHR